MKHVFRLFVFVAASLSFSSAFASPIPGMGSSALISPQLGLYRSALGFQIAASDSGWKHEAPPASDSLITTMFKDEKSGGMLTVRIDQLKKNMALDKYVQRWTKEYPRFGFDLLGARAFTQNKHQGYVLDLINREHAQQLRQVVFMKNRRAVILTCRDQVSAFKTSLKGCNSIIRSFSWTE